MSFREWHGDFPRLETSRLVLREIDPEKDAAGQLVGVGRLGVAGKTVCHRENSDGTSFSCSSYGNCTLPPALKTLIEEYGREFADRDYARIAAAAESGGERS
jgi:hypothetical protein